MLKISKMMVVVSAAPFDPIPMYLPLPQDILYLTHPAVVTKVTRSGVKYMHAPNK